MVDDIYTGSVMETNRTLARTELPLPFHHHMPHKRVMADADQPAPAHGSVASATVASLEASDLALEFVPNPWPPSQDLHDKSLS